MLVLRTWNFNGSPCFVQFFILKVSTLGHRFGWLELPRRLIDNQCHSLELMYFNVAVKKPPARIIRYEIDDHVPPSRNHNWVLSDRMAVDGKVFWFCFPTWSATSLFIAALFGTRDITTVYIAVMFSNKTSCPVILWISNMNNMKCVAMKMNWMSSVVLTNCRQHQLYSFVFCNSYYMNTLAIECGWIAVRS